MSYQVSLPAFEGPFELLFHLIEREEVDIWDIPIAHITEQYLEYVASMEELDIESAGEFLVMAATLLAIKARMLLPAPPSEVAEEEEPSDPRLELVARLLEYRRFRSAATMLAELAVGRDRLYPRGYTHHPEWDLPRFTHPVGGATLDDLVNAMRDVLASYRPPPATAVVPRRLLTVRESMSHIREALHKDPFCSFRNLLPSQPTRQDVVVTFLALLELVHRGHLAIAQQEAFGTIEIARQETSADLGDDNG